MAFATPPFFSCNKTNKIMGEDRYTGIKNDLRVYRSLLDGGVSDEKNGRSGMTLNCVGFRYFIACLRQIRGY
jgi:hypothetical protein